MLESFIYVSDEEFLVHFTSTTPEHMRYRLLNVDSDKAVKLTVWYSRPNRLDVFVDDQYVMATNARIKNGRYIITMPKGDHCVLFWLRTISFILFLHFEECYHIDLVPFCCFY